MAGVRFSAQSTEFATGTSKITTLQILAASNHRVLVDEVSVSFKGTDPVGEPILVELVVQSDAPAGSDSVTPQKTNPSDDETLQVTAREKFDGSTQPSETNVVKRWEVHPSQGVDWQAPYGKEIVVPGGGRLAISVTAAVTVSQVSRIEGCE